MDLIPLEIVLIVKGKGKAIPVEDWRGSEGSRL